MFQGNSYKFGAHTACFMGGEYRLENVEFTRTGQAANMGPSEYRVFETHSHTGTPHCGSHCRGRIMHDHHYRVPPRATGRSRTAGLTLNFCALQGVIARTCTCCRRDAMSTPSSPTFATTPTIRPFSGQS